MQLHGRGRVSGVRGMRTRERKGRAESASQGGGSGRDPSGWQGWTPDGVWTSARNPYLGSEPLLYDLEGPLTSVQSSQ